jgi:hypothetical protein
MTKRSRHAVRVTFVFAIFSLLKTASAACPDFAAHSDPSTGAHPYAVAIGDFNRDGRPDIVTASLDGGVSVLLQNANGTFQSPVGYSTGGNPQSITVADLNGDGKLDLVIADVSNNAAIVLLGTGAGTFGAAASYDIGGYPNSPHRATPGRPTRSP